MGLVTPDTGTRLAISTRTVDVHRMRIRRKLGLKTAAELAQFAMKWVLSSLLVSSSGRPSDVSAAAPTLNVVVDSPAYPTVRQNLRTLSTKGRITLIFASGTDSEG